MTKFGVNHSITSEMGLMPQGNSKRAWFWTGLITDSTAKSYLAMLAVKFETCDVAKKFHQHFMAGVTAAEKEAIKSKSNIKYFMLTKCNEFCAITPRSL